MNYFVKNIKINNLLHLHNFSISIPAESPHLIITGKNGSGKTILLKAIVNFLDIVKKDTTLNYTKYYTQLEYWKEREINNPQNILQARQNIEFYQKLIDELYSKVDIDIENPVNLITKYQKNEFIISFYGAGRLTKMSEPKNPTKPNLKIEGKAELSLTNQFLYFLSDLKVQEALARNEQQYADADGIKQWFDEFEQLLKDIYQDPELKLVFNYKNYSFTIKTGGKEFKFTEMSDGFMAAIDIIADLILKMQDDNSLVRAYQKPGIVLIDEIETHLHLELQSIVMPLLTRVFPNIQFIVTTHSPFVLNSIPNAVAYDLEHREEIQDLTEYSYEALAEGYFGVSTDSSYIEKRLDTLKGLLEKETLLDGEKDELLRLIADFDNIPEAVLPMIKGCFLQMKVQYSDKINELKR
ncbi:MAG: AAA family ATPase [Bacteroidales bacterium]|nr:AAA family ATPase [Bacteroidales bacterium]